MLFVKQKYVKLFYDNLDFAIVILWNNFLN